MVNHIPLNVLHSSKNERTSPEPFYARLCEKHISEYAKFGMFLHQGFTINGTNAGIVPPSHHFTMLRDEFSQPG